MIPPSVQAALQASGGAPSGNIADMVTGPLNAPVAGRTDHLPISVPDNAYVIPADVVSALGQGNTASGMKVLQSALAALAGPFLQAGGAGPAAGKVDIMAAGGEFVVPPQVVAAIGHGSLEQGHAALDAFVKNARAKNIETLRSMPGPKR